MITGPVRLAQVALVGVTLLLPLASVKAQEKPEPARKSKKERRRDALLAKASKKLGVPAQSLRKVGGERVLSRRGADLEALVRDLHKTRDPRLLPLLAHLALNAKKTPPLRYAAIKLLSVYALEGDNASYLALQDTFSALYRDRFQKAWELAADENHRLLRAFDLEQDVSPLLVSTLRGKHYLRAERAYRAVLDFRNPGLRAGVAQEALREALDPRSRFGIRQRSRAARENGLRGAPLSAAQLGKLMHKDGTIAVACAEALGSLGDPAGLPALRRVGRTSSHVLRVPALLARGKLQDASLIPLIGPTFEDDHVTLRVALVRAIVELRHPKVELLLERLDDAAQRGGDPKVQRALSLARLRRGHAQVVERLLPSLTRPEPDAGLARQVLAVEHKAAAPLVVAVAKIEAKNFAGLRRRAVAQLGSRRVEGEEVVALLRGLVEGDEKTALRLHAAASLVQLDAKGASKAVRRALKDFKVVTREDVKTGLGKARRYSGSHLGDVASRWARGRTWDAIPLLATWLDPSLAKKKGDAKQGDAKKGDAKKGDAKKGDAKKGDAKKGDAKGEGTRTRDPKAPAGPTGGGHLAQPPAKVPAFLKHAFVRREVVRALASLVRDGRAQLAGKGEASWPKGPDLKAQLALGLRGLDRSLDDSHLLVQRAAVRGLAALADHVLPWGASVEDEAAARKVAERVK